MLRMGPFIPGCEIHFMWVRIDSQTQNTQMSAVGITFQTAGNKPRTIWVPSGRHFRQNLSVYIPLKESRWRVSTATFAGYHLSKTPSWPLKTRHHLSPIRTAFQTESISLYPLERIKVACFNRHICSLTSIQDSFLAFEGQAPSDSHQNSISDRIYQFISSLKESRWRVSTATFAAYHLSKTHSWPLKARHPQLYLYIYPDHQNGCEMINLWDANFRSRPNQDNVWEWEIKLRFALPSKAGKESYPEWQPRGVAVKTRHLESFMEGHLHEALVKTEA